MTEIRFTLQQIPDGRWRLTENVADSPFPIERGLYKSPAEGEEAIKVILSPTIRHYDPNGDIIK